MMMQELSHVTPAETPASKSGPVSLWTPRAVALITFFFGFPAGLVLSVINWIRMELSDKAIMHFSIGAVATILLVGLLLLLPGSVANLLGLSANVGALL
jgi:apolipoprotein N-acyltransferase